MILKCKNCDNIWKYGGDQDYWATCPRCLRKVKIDRKEEKQNGE